MKNKTLLTLLLSMPLLSITAQNTTIDISGNNTSSSYVSYDKGISLPAGKSVDVLMARYCYFSSTINGKGTLNLYAGGERSYLGTAKGASWPNWTNFSGDIHIYPYRDNAPNAGFYGAVMAHGGKSFSPENVEEAVKSGKVNKSMENNHVTLHKGATLCCEANSNGAGFRIGELNTEEGSEIIGYMKKNTRAAYFLLGCLNTDATLAGTIAPPSYSDTHPVGIIKEGSGTYRITGNNNYLTGALRVMEGSVLVMNDREAAEKSKLRGALGAKTSDSDPVAYVFGRGMLGGTGSIGGTVDNYGVIEPGDGIGTLTIKNYATPSRKAHLLVRPASVLRFEVGSTTNYDQLVVGGQVKYLNMTEDFTTSDKMPIVELVIDESADVKVGDEFRLVTAQSKTSEAGEWHFELAKSERYTWELVEQEEDGGYTLMLRLVSLETPDTPDEPGDQDNPNDKEQMGAFYDDGIDDAKDRLSLRYYALKNNKWIGTAISTWKNDISNAALAESQEAGGQFNMLVAENEMKFDALQPSQGQFSFGSADKLVSFAVRNNMKLRGHCLAWHSQLPQWVSSDGKKNDKNWTRKEALKILEEHITKVMTHFKGKVAEWDVVNECLSDDQTTVRTDPNAYDLRESVWTRAIGEDFIDSAFVYAHRVDPEARLFLNDYDVEFQGKAKTTAFYNLAMRLKKDGIPIHGVGLQCHLSIGDVDSVRLENNIRRFGEAGLECIITELDMGVPSTTAENLEEQARSYRVITDIVLNNDNCPSMVIWGLKDNDSWRSASNPLLYTASLSRKPAWYAVRSALRHRKIVNENTSVPGIIDYNSDSDQKIYDLSGRIVDEQSLRPGIYIKGGRKYLIDKE